MLRAYYLIFAAAALLAASACAYAPEATTPSWTDAQLNEAPPARTPQFVPDERIGAGELGMIETYRRTLVEARDKVQTDADAVPDIPTDSDDYAERARERTRLPESR